MEAWGVVKTLVLGVLSFGLLPLLVMRYRWIHQTELEKQWMDGLMNRPASSSNTVAKPNRKSDTLAQCAKAATTQRLAWIVIGGAVGVMAWFFIQWLGHETFSLTTLLASTYQFNPRHIGPPPLWRSHLFLAWTLGLSLAYAAHWVAVQWHVTRMREFLAALPSRASHPQPPAPDVGLGLSPRWILGAVVMVLFGGYWGIFMMMAGGVQRQYARRCAMQWRKALGQPTPQGMLAGGAVCPNNFCRKELPPHAAYCPRCGWKI